MRALCILAAMASSNVCAESLFPKLRSCTEDARSEVCDLILSNSGFLIDRKNSKQLYSVSKGDGVLDINWLYKTDHGYLLESLNFSSSRTKNWITFRYSDGQFFIKRLYHFSRWGGVSAPPLWQGYECRGESKLALRTTGLLFGEAAMWAACGKEFTPNKAATTTQVIPQLNNRELSLNIPVVNGMTIEQKATYKFWDSEDPDIFSMLCLSGCGSLPAQTSYFGRIGKRSAIKVNFSSRGLNARGVYRYALSATDIELEGRVDDKRMDLVEHDSSRGVIRAYFIGEASGDGYRGTWVSKNGDNKEYEYFIYPSPIH